MKEMNLAESLALSILRGDKVAAYALADMLLEERANTTTPQTQAHDMIQAARSMGHDVYHWPEFRAFADRIGLKWDLNTIEVTIRLSMDELVTIEQKYRGIDVPIQ